MNNGYFITVAYIKKWYSAYIEGNIDDNLLNTFILTAQEMRLQQCLGYDLYMKFVTDIATYGSPQGENYIYLMNNWIQKCTALWTIYTAMDSLATKITNKGVVNKTSDVSETASDQRLTNKMNNLISMSQFYEQRIKEYIMNNTGFYPEYFQTTGVGRLRPNSEYFGGLYLGDSGYISSISDMNKCCGRNTNNYI